MSPEMAFTQMEPAPGWALARKVGVGTACSLSSRVWFTLSQGIITEVYYPRVDIANTREVQFLISDGRSFFHSEQRDLRHRVEYMDSYALGYALINEDPAGRYRLTKRVVTDPDSDALIVHARFEPLQGQAADYKLYVLLSCRMKNQPAGNIGKMAIRQNRKLLLAWRDDIYLSLAASVPLGKVSCGSWAFAHDWDNLWQGSNVDEETCYTRDSLTFVAGLLTGRKPQFTLALGFGPGENKAIDSALEALDKPYFETEQKYLRQWQNYCACLNDFSSEARDGGRLYYISAMVLKAHEDKTVPGASVASLSSPWEGSPASYCYHCCWPRDLAHVATALLAIGDSEAVVRALGFLGRTQNEDGGWPQNCWVDGRPHWPSWQLDEVAHPILLARRLYRSGVLQQVKYDPYSMVRRAALFIARNGPVTPQERWEENAGYSPSTLAVCISALICASCFAREKGEEALARYFEEVADYWATKLEDWTFTRCGQLLPGQPEYYERIATVTLEELTPSGRECLISLPIINLPAGQAQPCQCCVVDASFLELVRHGLRDPDDPRILKTLLVSDALLKVETPYGPVWHRYNLDGYGEKEDGNPFDGTGLGRAWPLLTGERGHYEVSARRDPSPYIAALEQFANEGGMLPEQVWDIKEIPEKGLFLGKGTNSATPLAWAHAEYIRLLRSRRDGTVFDTIPEVKHRYSSGQPWSKQEIWKFNHKLRAASAGKHLRLEVNASAYCHWTLDGWATVHHDPMPEVAKGAGIYAIDFPSASLEAGHTLEFTFYWPQVDRWEGKNFTINLASDLR